MGGSTADFPGLNEVLIGSRSFLVNTSFEPYRRDAFRHRSIQSQRESVNVAGKTGEGTINTEGLWRASATDWSLGAGQLYADRDDSSAARFYESFGVNPWTKNQLSLLNATKVLNADTTADDVVTVGPLIFKSTRTAVSWSTDYVTWTNIITYTVSSGLNPRLSTDGSNLYIAASSFVSTPGIFVVPITDVGGNPGVGSPQTYTTDPVTLCKAVAGRIIAAVNNNLYDITPYINQTNVHLPTALMTHPNQFWLWSDITAGSAAIYFTGFCSIDTNGQLGIQPNTPSAVYRSQMEPDGTALSAPVVALPLPADETAFRLFAYLNNTFLLTTKGIRMCRTVSASDPEGNTGDLIAGPILPNLLHQDTGPEYGGIVGSGRFIYFSWPNFDGVHSGLGRLDLGTMIADLQPAYASDLMYPSVGSAVIRSVFWDPVADAPAFLVFGVGIVGVDTANLVSHAWIDSGRITYNIPDDKIACQGLLRRDAGTFVTLSAPLPTTPITALPVTALQAAVVAGDEISVSDGWQVDVFTASGPAITGATSIPVNSQTPTEAYPTGSTVQDVTTPAATQQATPGTVSMLLQADGGGFQPVNPLSPNTQQNPPVLMSPLVRGEEFNVRILMTPTGANGPTLHRWMLKSLPAVASGATISPVLMLYVNTQDAAGRPRFEDPYDDYAYLEGLRLSKTPITYEEGTFTATVVVDEIDWLPFKERDNPDFGYEGDCIVYLKSIVG